MSIVGGTASAIAGGDFKNGAMTGAFVQMFNHEMGQAMKTKSQMEQNGRKDLSIAHERGKKGYYVTDNKGFKYMSDTPEMRQNLRGLQIGLGIVAAPVVIAGGYTATMAYPIEMMTSDGVLNG